MIDAFLMLDIVSGPLITTFFAVAAALVLYLLARRPTRRWLITIAIALIFGVIVSIVAWFIIVRVNNTFNIPISLAVYAWFTAAVCAVCVACVNLWRSRWWRKVIAGIAIVVFIATGTLAVNAQFGFDRTLGAFLGVVPQNPVTLPSRPATASPSPVAEPLWKSWTPPADLPKQGTVGTQIIPNTLSGFNSRPAGIYLPPAALVANAPALPLVILMMGQPGSPDPQYVAAVLDDFAATHNGLAPIVIVADQLGNSDQDPLCLNTAAFGNAETFITTDVVNWALANLNITHDHRDWTIAGYSNGGGCAISFMAKYPALWSNLIDVSGEEYPGSEQTDQVLSDIFNGDQAAYDAIKPSTLLANHALPGTFGVFTVGSDDAGFIPGIQNLTAAASTAGMTVVYYEVPNGGHVLPALTEGLKKGFELLYPRLGLAP